MKLYAIIAAFFGAIATLFTARKSGKDAERLKQAKQYQNTRKRIDNEKGSSGDTGDDIEWLREYGDKRSRDM